MNWLAFLGLLIFGGLLAFGLRTGTMPMAPYWSPFRDDEPVWFWLGATIYGTGAILSLAAWVGLLR